MGILHEIRLAKDHFDSRPALSGFIQRPDKDTVDRHSCSTKLTEGTVFLIFGPDSALQHQSGRTTCNVDAENGGELDRTVPTKFPCSQQGLQQIKVFNHSLLLIYVYLYFLLLLMATPSIIYCAWW